MCIRHDPQNLQNVYAGEGPDETATGNGFFKSTDGGETWGAKNYGLPMWPAVRQISINPFHTNEIYVYCRYNGGPGIYKSSDYGESWELFFDHYIISTIVFNSEDSTVQYAFDVDGSIHEWKNGIYNNISSSINFSSTGYPAGTFLNSKTGSFFYATGSKLYKRTDDSDWVSKLSGLNKDSLTFTNIISADINQLTGTIYVCTDKCVLISSDDGENWLINKEFDNMMVKTDSSKTFLIGYKGLYVSADSGKQWLRVSNGASFGSVNQSSVVLKNDKHTIYSICKDNYSFTGFLNKSADDGNQWIKLELPGNVLPVSVKANPFNPDIVYIGCNNGLYKSCNGGINWKEILPDNSVPTSTVKIFPADTSHILVGSNGKIFESFDSGDSWNDLPVDTSNSNYQVNCIGISQKNPRMICAGVLSGNSYNQSGIFISTNGGKSWKRKVNGLSEDRDHVIITAIAIDPTNDDNIFIGNYSGIYRSKDMGNRWLSYSDMGDVTDIKFVQDNPKSIFVTTKGITYDGTGGLYLLKDTDNYSEEILLPDRTKDSRSSIEIFPEGNKYKVFVGTASHGFYIGEYPREILLPQKPLIISPDDLTGVNLKTAFNWHPSDLAVQYSMQVASDSLFSSVVFDTTITDTTVQLNNPLSANSQFYWHVKGVNMYGDTSYSLTADFATGTSVSINEDKNMLPDVFTLSQNYPNPFNPATVINYSIPKTSFVTIKIYNVLGGEVTTLVNEEKSAGNYKLKFKAENLASGIYFYRMQAGDFTSTKKLILLK